MSIQLSETATEAAHPTVVNPDNTKEAMHGIAPTDQSGRTRLAQESFDPVKAKEQLSMLNAHLNKEATALNLEVARQGVLGETIDYLKNHFGASEDASPRDGLAGFLRYAWSYVLNYDLGSAAGRQDIEETRAALIRASQAVEKNDGTAFEKELQGVARFENGKPAGLQTDGVAVDYDESQRRGVALMADLASLGTAAVAGKIAPALRLVAPIIGGAAGKDLAKAIDGAYFLPMDDTTTGALLGLTLPLGRYYGLKTEEGILARNSKSLFSASAHGHAVDSAINGGMLNAVSFYENTLADNGTRSQALSSAALHFPIGAAAGGLIGFGLGGGAYYWRQLRHVSAHAPHAADDGEAHVTSRAIAKMFSMSRRFFIAEKAGANVIATKVTMGRTHHAVPDDDRDY